ncbi:DUF3558 family protein [Saccharopolyspora sp. TS4A08]|uniref:DUF3558 family protein n=1 Tax=Saccharopolyspora ipomoeae TaxID=3042027 RepID=A0ABT6PMX0_9PSEU|nr:DUF3558 family protein [Saccharopolyspora sp. TS4A08]MDI2029003.1 DUF3558 family protein [Saccharopolyspora sp. TS4A08]
MTRLLVAVAAAATGFALAGCSGGAAPEAPAPKPENALAGFDPCKVDLQNFGASAPGEPVDQGVGEQGCEYDAEGMTVAVYKGETNDFKYWEQRRGNLAVFEPNQVGSHQGIKQIANGSVGQGVCNQAIMVGSGSVSVQVNNSASNEQSDDATCAKALEIANAIEPSLPQ